MFVRTPRRLSLPLEQVRVILYPNLPSDEGRARVEAAITGAADIDTWRRIEKIAAREPDLFTHLFAASKDLRAERREAYGV